MNCRIPVVIAACALLALSGSFASAAILEDFQFNDPDDTLLGSAANSVNPLNLWAEDTTDMDNSSVQGGVYRIQKESAVTPSGFGTNFLQIDNVSSGQIWLVAEIAGWHFASGTDDLNDFDPSQREEIRFDFLNNDTGTSGSEVTAEVEIERNPDGGIEIHAVALGAGTDIPAKGLPLTQSEPFTVVLAIDKDADTYEIFTKSGGGAIGSVGGPATVDSLRNANSVRFVANNSFAGDGEFFDIGRIYLTDTNPIPEPASLVMLVVGLLGLFLVRRGR